MAERTLAVARAWQGAVEPYVVGDPGRAASHTVPLPDEAHWDRHDTVLDGVTVRAERRVLGELRAVSIRGLAHRHYGRVRQDEYSYRRTQDGRYLVMCVADGVSIGKHSHYAAMATAHLPRFVNDLHNRRDLGGPVESWWVRRHRDMIRLDTDQHLAVFLRLTSPEQYGPVAAQVAAFAAELDTRGLPCQLALAPTPQHPARYGDGPALAAAEQVFAADTTAAIAQLAAAEASGTPAQALAAASMTHLAASFAPDPQTGYRSLLGCLRQEHGPLDRTLRDHALNLANPDHGYSAVRALPGGEMVAAAWLARDSTLSGYYQALLQQQREPGTVLRTLLHEHHVRAVGVDPTFEKETGRLARAAALRLLALAGAR